MENNVITFEEVQKRLINTKLEDYTSEDVMDRYIAYGSDEELNNPEVQKLFIKYGYTNELINLVSGVITDQNVIKAIINTNNFENETTKCLKGKIHEINLEEDSNLPENTCWMIIKFKSNINNQIYILKDIYFKDVRMAEGDIDKYKEIQKFKNETLMTIIEKDNDNWKLVCFMKNIND